MIIAEVSNVKMDSFFGVGQVVTSDFESFLQSVNGNMINASEDLPLEDVEDVEEKDMAEQFLLLLKRIKNDFLLDDEKKELSDLVDERYHFRKHELLLEEEEEEKDVSNYVQEIEWQQAEKLVHIIRLATEIEIEKPEDIKKFGDFMIDLLEKGLITLQDLEKLSRLLTETEQKGEEFPVVKVILEKLWDSIKTGDETKQAELLSELENFIAKEFPQKEIEKIEPAFLRIILDNFVASIENENNVEKKEAFLADVKEVLKPETRTGIEQKPIEKSIEKLIEKSIDKPVEKVIDKNEKPIEKTNAEKTGFELKPEGEKSENKGAKPEAQQTASTQPVQPEVRAVWEGGGLKIEVIDSKTGEKLQSVPASGNTQERMHEYEVIRQVVAKAKFITTPTGEQKLTIQLRPDHLGQLDLRIVLNRGEMQIHARVESATAQQALENHIGFLREGLEKQGITLERLEVSIEQKDKQDAWSLMERQEQRERRGNRKHRQGRETHLAVSIANDAGADTGRRLGYNTMEYLA
ncbi:MAG: flagellar hook-length control protein FliK [Fibromonadaceae bacterium]|jgi:flagellar hook-length control protein FliK|nr:flagellar hook-length control protein FliK [Fibromonadaceae bacterium]